MRYDDRQTYIVRRTFKILSRKTNLQLISILSMDNGHLHNLSHLNMFLSFSLYVYVCGLCILCVLCAVCRLRVVGVYVFMQVLIM